MFRLMNARFRIGGKSVTGELPVLVIIAPSEWDRPRWFGAYCDARTPPALRKCLAAGECELEIAGQGSFAVRVTAIEDSAVRFTGLGAPPKLKRRAVGKATRRAA